MKLGELSEIISKQVKTDEVSVRRTLKAAMVYIREQMDKEERFIVPGLGVFVRREGKEPGQVRVAFKPLKEKEGEDA